MPDEQGSEVAGVTGATTGAASAGRRLTREAIVAAAIVVADRDGMDGLSMRRIADELGVGAMSLYRHIPDKDALLGAMADEIARRFPYPPAGTAPADEGVGWTWREWVRVAADVDRELYQRHPWVVLVYAAPRYSFGAESLRCLDWMVAGFRSGLGVDVETATEMSLTVWGFVHGVALVDAGQELLGAAPDDRPSGLADLIAGNVADAPPTLRGLVGASAERLLDSGRRVDAGLDYLCAGFAARAMEFDAESDRS